MDTIHQNDKALLNSVKKNKQTLKHFLSQQIFFNESTIFQAVRYLIDHKKTLMLKILLQKLHPKYVFESTKDNTREAKRILGSILNYEKLRFENDLDRYVLKNAVSKEYIYLIDILLKARKITEQILKVGLEESLNSTNEIFEFLLNQINDRGYNSVILETLIKAVERDDSDEKISILLDKIDIQENKYILEAFLKCNDDYDNQILLILDKKKDDNLFLIDAATKCAEKDLPYKLKILLKNCINILGQDGLPEKIFKIAFTNQSLKTLKLILDEKWGFSININCFNEKNLNALAVAGENDNYPMMKFLLKQKDIDINAIPVSRKKQINSKIKQQKTLKQKFTYYSASNHFLYTAAKRGDIATFKGFLNIGKVNTNILNIALMYFMEKNGYNQTNKVILYIKYNLDTPDKKYSEKFLNWAQEHSEFSTRLKDFSYIHTLQQMFIFRRDPRFHDLVPNIFKYLINNLNSNNLREILKKDYDIEMKRKELLANKQLPKLSKNRGIYKYDTQKIFTLKFDFRLNNLASNIFEYFIKNLHRAYIFYTTNGEKLSEFLSAAPLPLQIPINQPTQISIEDVFQERIIHCNESKNVKDNKTNSKNTQVTYNVGFRIK